MSNNINIKTSNSTMKPVGNLSVIGAKYPELENTQLTIKIKVSRGDQCVTETL